MARALSIPLVIVHTLLSHRPWSLPSVACSSGARRRTGRTTARGRRPHHFVRSLNERLDGEEEETALDNELQILQNALDFSSLKARDCLVPRNEIVALDAGAGLDELDRCFQETGLSKVVIYRGDIDHIVGYVHSKDLLRKAPLAEGEEADMAISKLLHPTIIVPEPMGAQDILAEFIRRKRHLAVVVDEYGGTSGILTMEDIVEELIGDIEDEHDTEALVEMEIGKATSGSAPGMRWTTSMRASPSTSPRTRLTRPSAAGPLPHRRDSAEGTRLQFDRSTVQVTRVDGARIVLVEVLQNDGESA